MKFCYLRQFFYFCHPEMNPLDLLTRNIADRRTFSKSNKGFPFGEAVNRRIYTTVD